MEPSAATIESEHDELPRFEDDDGNIYTGAEAIRRANAHFAEIEARNRAYVESLTERQREELQRELERRATPSPELVVATETAPATNRTTPRPRGAGRPPMRRSAQRSSARSGDSGDDGPSDPSGQPVDRVLWGLREPAREYELERVYELIPGEGNEPDRWKARCPVHPDVSACTLLITELPDGDADLWCSVGCDPGGIVRILVPDPEREARAAAYAEVLLWAQSFKSRRAA